MTMGEAARMLRLRPHHIFCDKFLPEGDLGRGEEFAHALIEIKDMVDSQGDLTIIVTEGPDELCIRCPYYENGRCESPAGNEEEVRKWDERVRQGLGVAYGDEFAADDLQALVDQKAPLDFCKDRCPWKAFCGVFGG